MTKKISPKHLSNEWNTDLADVNSPTWTSAIEIIRTRFESRYFSPIKQLLNSNDKTVKYNCGFLIMSIDSLLIETLNQFIWDFSLRKKSTKEKILTQIFN